MNPLITPLKEAGQDFEFYPTTQEIIDLLIKDLKRKEAHYSGLRILDIGAGNGKVLSALNEAGLAKELYAIEKSQILCGQLPKEVIIAGTTFEEQSLLCKEVDVIFSNPPYSSFEDWMIKIIREATAPIVYLVIPERWEKLERVKDALRFRDGNPTILGNFDFLESEDRQARAKVHLLKIAFPRRGERDEPFNLFFKEQFGDFINRFESNEPTAEEEPQKAFSDLVIGPNYPEALVNLYNLEIQKIQRNYQLISELDRSLLKEFEIHPEKIMTCLKQRLNGLRNNYWKELFSHLESVTSRLTSKSRQKLLETLQKHSAIDFTIDNILAVMCWVVKNANIYIEDQLLETYDLMVEKCNVKLYKSNQRAWIDDRWRYREEPEKNSHYGLDFRIVMHRAGGIDASEWVHRAGLEERAAQFLGDLMTLGHNLGFICQTSDPRFTYDGRRHWTSGAKEEFRATDSRTGKECTLFEAKAFKNGNIHLKLHKRFILALNVEHGRLKGWLNSGPEAAEELQEPEAADLFKTTIQLCGGNQALQLLAA